MATQKQQAVKMSREQRIEHQKNLELPINKFLNSTNQDGTVKYPVAQKLRDYFINDPDAATNAIAMAEGFLHTIEWRKQMASKYFAAHHSQEPITLRNKDGEIMSKDDCYLAYVSMLVNIQTGISDLRKHIVGPIVGLCDGVVFSFEQCNDLIMSWEARLKKIGYELFPTKVQIVKP